MLDSVMKNKEPQINADERRFVNQASTFIRGFNK